MVPIICIHGNHYSHYRIRKEILAVVQNNTALNELRLAESIEITAWSDCFAAAPASLGCSVSTVPGVGATLLLTKSVPAPILNRVLGLPSSAALDDATFDWIKQVYRDGAMADFWLAVWDGLDDNALKAGCDERGWKPDEQTVLAKSLFDLERPLPAVPQSKALRVRPATLEEHALAGDIICRNFGLPDNVAPWMAALVGRPRWQMFFACDESGAPVATGALFIDGAHAWLGMGTTLPESRERGAQRMLLATRLAAAKAAGCTVAVIESAAPIHGEVKHSFNNIRWAGFRELARCLNYLRPSA
jgi:GNAT superfamily N-acetyltransferase